MTPEQIEKLKIGDRVAILHPTKVGVRKMLSGTVKEIHAQSLPACIFIGFDGEEAYDSWRFAREAEYLGDPNAPKYPAINPREEPCIQCGRKNFVGDRKCWWCECPNPTARAS